MTDIDTLIGMTSHKFDAPLLTTSRKGHMSRRQTRKAEAKREQVERATRTVYYAIQNDPTLTREEAVSLVLPTWQIILSYIIQPLIAQVAEWVWDRLQMYNLPPSENASGTAPHEALLSGGEGTRR